MLWNPQVCQYHTFNDKYAHRANKLYNMNNTQEKKCLK